MEELKPISEKNPVRVKSEVKANQAKELADLTFQLLANCQEKEARLAEQYRLTQAEFRCLRLFGKTETLNNKTIAERMNLSPSRLTRIIDGLVTKNYMLREIDTKDRRNMRVSLSHQGTIIVQKLNAAYINIHKEILEDIEEPQHDPLINAMTQLLTALEKWIAKT
jgi:DNA-binding MarR family transcriptional regulator